MVSLNIDSNMTVRQLMNAYENTSYGTLRVYTDVNKQNLADPRKKLWAVRLLDKDYEEQGIIFVRDYAEEFCEEMLYEFGLVVEVVSNSNNFVIDGNKTIRQLMDSFRNAAHGSLRVYTDVKKQNLANPRKRVKTVRLKDKNYEESGSIFPSSYYNVGEFCEMMQQAFGLIVDVADLDNSMLILNQFPMMNLHYLSSETANSEMLDYMVEDFDYMEFDNIEANGTSYKYRYSLIISLHENIDQVIEEPFDTMKEAEERMGNFIEEKTSSLHSEFYTVSERPDGITELHLRDSDWWYELRIDEV